MPGIPSALASLGVGHGGMAAAAAAASRLGLSGLATAGGHNVLLVSNLNPEVSELTRLKQLYISSVKQHSNIVVVFVYTMVHGNGSICSQQTSDIFCPHLPPPPCDGISWSTLTTVFK